MWDTIAYYVVLALESMIGVFGIRLYEEPQYEIIGRVAGNVEIRRYAPRLAAEVELPAGGRAARGQAFQLLFDYISGTNRTASGSSKIAMTVPVEVRDNERIAMTAPVQTAEDGATLRMIFFLPAKYDHDSAPAPRDDRVKIVTIPDETIAVLRYSGLGRDFRERQAELVASLAGSKWRPIGSPSTLYYDAPFTIPFLRRNEAAVAVTPTQ